jgi:hypothetical protein
VKPKEAQHMKRHKTRKMTIGVQAETLRHLSVADLRKAVAGVDCDTTSVTTEARRPQSEVGC